MKLIISLRGPYILNHGRNGLCMFQGYSIAPSIEYALRTLQHDDRCQSLDFQTLACFDRPPQTVESLAVGRKGQKLSCLSSTTIISQYRAKEGPVSRKLGLSDNRFGRCWRYCIEKTQPQFR